VNGRSGQVPLDRDLVEIAGGCRVGVVQGEVVDEQHVHGDELADLVLVAVVQPGGFEPLEQPVGAFGVGADPPAAGDVTERVGEVGLANTDGPEDERALVVLDEPQGGELGEHVAVVADGVVVLPRLQRHGGIQPGGTRALGGAGAVTPVDLVGEDQLEERRVGELVLLGQGEPFGQGIGASCRA